MTNKLSLWIATLALSTIAMAGAKSYDVVLSTASKAGSVQLAAGDYKVKVEGANAIFTAAQSRESFTVPVKIENTDTKYDSTMLESTKQGGTEQITAIKLGGSKTKLEFGQ